MPAQTHQAVEAPLYIDDQSFEIVRRAWAAAMAGTVTDAEAALLQVSVGPLFEELAGHRRRAAESLDLAPAPAWGGDNVIPLHGPEGAPCK